MTGDEILASVQRWAAGEGPGVRAAVGLLAWHDRWINRRADFRAACVRYDKDDRVYWIRWADARAFAETQPRGSSGEITILNIAVTLGENGLGFSHVGPAHKRAIAEAFMTALE